MISLNLSELSHSPGLGHLVHWLTDERGRAVGDRVVRMTAAPRRAASAPETGPISNQAHPHPDPPRSEAKAVYGNRTKSLTANV